MLHPSLFLQMPRAWWDTRICGRETEPASCDFTKGARTIEYASEAHLLSNAGKLLIVPAEDGVPLLRREVQRLLCQNSAVSRCANPSRQLCKVTCHCQGSAAAMRVGTSVTSGRQAALSKT